MNEQHDDPIQKSAEAPQRKKAPPRPADLFSTARTVALKLEPFSYEEQLQTLSFVRSGIEAKYKAQVLKQTEERYLAPERAGFADEG